MKKQLLILVVGVLCCALLPGSILAQAITQAIPVEDREKGVEVIYLKAFIDKAGDLIEEKGEAAFIEFRKPGSPWNNGGADLFIIQATEGDENEGGFVVAPDSQFVGKGALDMDTVNARPYLQNVKTKGEGGTFFFFIPSAAPGPASAYKIVKVPSGRSYVLTSGVDSLDHQHDFVKLLVETACNLIAEQGEKVFPLIRKEDSVYRFKDTYVFVLTDKGIPVIDPATPEYEGVDMIKTHPELADVYRKILKMANSEKGYGWVEYEWIKPGGTERKGKAAFVKKVHSAEGDFIVGSGVYLDE